MAYILGYFAADGSIIVHKSGGKYIEITSTDKVLLTKLLTVTGSQNSISIRQKRNAKWKEQYRVQIGSREWFSDLINLGFTARKSKTLAFPKVPQAFISDFVRGYFDGDGCVYFAHLQFSDRKNKRPILQTLFTSGSQSFLISLWKELRKHGIKGGSLVEKKRGFELKFSHTDSLALYNLLYNTCSTTGLYLPRKRTKLKQALRTIGLLRA